MIYVTVFTVRTGKYLTNPNSVTFVSSKCNSVILKYCIN